MSKRVRIIAAAILAVCLLTLAGCGGGSSNPAPPTPKVVLGHHCSKADEVMNCVLPPAPLSVQRLTVPSIAQGIDFAWSCPSPQGQFAASYLSTDPTKNWTPGCVNEWHAAGRAVVMVWETGANEAQSGYGAGQSDARQALAQADALGLPSDRPIFFAVDFDSTGQTGSIVAYFQGVGSVLGVHRTGAYGGLATVSSLFDAGLIGYGWQSYAWSGGAWDGRAKLEQFLNGSSVDYDRGIAPDYGQWPYVAPAPPGPTHAQILSWQRARDASLHAYERKRCSMPVLGPPNCGKFAWRVVHFQTLIPGRHPACWGPRAQTHAAVCEVVRPELAIWGRASASSYNAARARGCYGPSGQTPVRSPFCDGKFAEAHYFAGRVSATFGQWR